MLQQNDYYKTGRKFPMVIPNFVKFKSNSKSPSKITLKLLELSPPKVQRPNFVIKSFLSSRKIPKRSQKNNLSSRQSLIVSETYDNTEKNDLYYDNETFAISSLVTIPKTSFPERPFKFRSIKSSHSSDKPRAKRNKKNTSTGCDPFIIQEVYEPLSPCFISH